MEQPGQHLGGRENIRAAAMTLFAEKGFAATTTREICEKARVTKPALYYHFGNKEQLYTGIVFDAFQEYLKELDQAASRSGSYKEKFIKVITAIFQFCERQPETTRMVFRMALAPEKESPAIDYVQMAEADERLLARIANEALDAGEISCEAVDLAYALIGATRFYLMSFLVTGRPELTADLASRVVCLILRGAGGSAANR
ncbi:MAG: TetR/AcrR family transcriptional regulator [Acidobacteria bacterium]|nr:MAG: TetR/AcrR family transcriptional regulator [Acidobacteriota bacterium]